MRMNAVKLKFEKDELKTSEDVDEYIDTLKEALLELVKQNKRISL